MSFYAGGGHPLLQIPSDDRTTGTPNLKIRTRFRARCMGVAAVGIMRCATTATPRTQSTPPRPRTLHVYGASCGYRYTHDIRTITSRGACTSYRCWFRTCCCIATHLKLSRNYIVAVYYRRVLSHTVDDRMIRSEQISRYVIHNCINNVVEGSAYIDMGSVIVTWQCTHT